MKRKSVTSTLRLFIAVIFAVGATIWADNAVAHVDYSFINAAGGSASLPMKRFGWIDGTDVNLGDSHQVSFFAFQLNEDSLVNITMTGANELGLNPAFTLYRGLLPGQGMTIRGSIRSIPWTT